ncbi:Protein-S-isoprenylcysteine O-methyltransferase Ste14 [Natronorubrum sediminis]|uniref:Protein-S-isoprenylcysteine O-methyltransferase Ste14 n=1 Tax=Natronorubrum sediminis TaxID=640943 RepID=A0A1H6FY18_9EURY|nr:isoprenylcysteine carboxylmethyltransferase family protein [Natronorubrum sediminis]SEH15078.1 Protein-S-isoprenylcysteine O-methyltransferase Ste14 [Natronorubrum sediminis]
MLLATGFISLDVTFEHAGAWALALIMIVVVSWLFYRYFAPESWREWAGAGVVQAFIIALYAEMFGFPLTIYLLIRFGGLDREYASDNLWSTLVGIGETGMFVSMLVGYSVALIGILLFIQGWRQVHRARQEDHLVTSGLYSYVRHPQYTGLFLALFGEGIVHWPTIFSVGLFPIIVLTFTWLARKEERDMLDQFGEEYRTYQQEVPLFVPRLGQWRRFVRESRSP